MGECASCTLIHCDLQWDPQYTEQRAPERAAGQVCLPLRAPRPTAALLIRGTAMQLVDALEAGNRARWQTRPIACSRYARYLQSPRSRSP